MLSSFLLANIRLVHLGDIQVTGYYRQPFRYGSPEDFSLLLDALQNEGIGVIIDWVPAHFPSDEFASPVSMGPVFLNIKILAKGTTRSGALSVSNYGRSGVRSFLIGSAIAWLDRFGIDGFRVDAVASMLYLDYSRKEGSGVRTNMEGMKI